MAMNPKLMLKVEKKVDQRARAKSDSKVKGEDAKSNASPKQEPKSSSNLAAHIPPAGAAPHGKQHQDAKSFGLPFGIQSEPPKETGTGAFGLPFGLAHLQHQKEHHKSEEHSHKKEEAEPDDEFRLPSLYLTTTAPTKEQQKKHDHHLLNHIATQVDSILQVVVAMKVHMAKQEDEIKQLKAEIKSLKDTKSTSDS